MDINKIAETLQQVYTEEEIGEISVLLQQAHEELRAQDKKNLSIIEEAQVLEKEKRPREAAALYEHLLSRNFDGNHVYDRLAIIYKKLKRPEDVVRVLEKAVYVFENVVYKERADRVRKLEKFKKELGKAKSK